MVPTALVLLAALLPLVLAPVRARYLGPTGRGEFAFFQAAVMVITAASGGGIRHAYYGQHWKGDRRGALWTRRVWMSALVLAALAGVPLAVIAFVSLGPVIGGGVVVVMLGAPLFALVQLEMADAQFHQRQFRVAGLTSIPACVEFAANLGLLAARSLTVTSAIAVTVFSEFTRGISAIVYHRLDHPAETRPPRNRAASRELAARSLHFLPATLVPLVAANIDSIVYGALGHSTALGVYSVAKLVPTFLLLAAGVSEGRFLARAARDGSARAATSLALPLVGLGALAAVLGAALVEPLFGAPFAPARSAFAVTAVVGVAGALYVWFVAICAQRGLRRVSLWSSVVTLLVGLTGSITIGLTPSPSPTIMGLPVLAGYTLGLIAIGLSLRSARRRHSA